MFKEEVDSLLENYTFIENERKIENLDNYLLEVSSINALLDYLNQTQKMKLEHINLIHVYLPNELVS